MLQTGLRNTIKMLSVLTISIVCFGFNPRLALALQNGPMLGAVEMSEARIWVQTETADRVQLKYWIDSKPEQYFWSQEVQTSLENDFTHVFVLGNLKTGSLYQYQVVQAGKALKQQAQQQFRTQIFWQNHQNPPDFTLALGSCVYLTDTEADPPNQVMGGDYSIFESIHALAPDFMLWLGDNIYLRFPDFYARSAIDKRYRQLRALPEIQKLQRGIPNYAIWDDHDFGDNDADRAYRLRTESLHYFKRYWANPSYGTQETPGIFTRFQWSDAEFFLTDNRFYRAPNADQNPQKDYFGPEQLQWLKDSLISSDARFKIIAVGNQVLNTQNPSENMYTYQKEYQNLLDWLANSRIQGVILLSGDRHHSEMLKLERPGLYPLYEWTVSPLTSNFYPPFPEEVDLAVRIPGSLFLGRNFGLLQLSGPPEDRQISFSLRDAQGKEQWHYALNASALESPIKP